MPIRMVANRVALNTIQPSAEDKKMWQGASVQYATANKFFFRDMSGESFDNLVQENESIQYVF